MDSSAPIIFQWPGISARPTIRRAGYRVSVESLERDPVNSLGQTETYSDIATTLGTPQATRAVARACATNPVAIVIPCHRVIGKDGSLRGYAWGVKRKKTLLSLENKVQRNITKE